MTNRKKKTSFTKDIKGSNASENSERNEICRIIDEYKEQNNLETITEEEIIMLFGESVLYPNLYFSPWKKYWENGVEISDYEAYLLERGINVFEPSPETELEKLWFEEAQKELDELNITEEYRDLGDVEQLSDYDQLLDALDVQYFNLNDEHYDTFHEDGIRLFYHEDTITDHDGFNQIQPYEVSEELCWVCNHWSFEKSLQEATVMDRMYLEMDPKGNITGHGFFDIGISIFEYFMIKELDYEDMKVEEPDCLSEGEYECSLADDLDYFLSIGTKTVDIYVSDLIELVEFFQKPIHETVSRQIIHLEVSAKRFLIVVDIDEQYIFYKVFHQLDRNDTEDLKSLGWDIYHESVFDIINYYLETGLTIECFQ